MKFYMILLSFFFLGTVFAHARKMTDAQALSLFRKNRFEEVLPYYKEKLKSRPKDVLTNRIYGTCLFKLSLQRDQAESCLKFASSRKDAEASLVLAFLYLKNFRLNQAKLYIDKTAALVKKKDKLTATGLHDAQLLFERYESMFSHSEDIQFIDSVSVDKRSFLTAFKLSPESGSLGYARSLFPGDSKNRDAIVYSNEDRSKQVYAMPDTQRKLSLFSRSKLLNGYTSGVKLSSTDFGLSGMENYPFLLTDGVTIYFAATDSLGMGGYDLYVSRYNTETGHYLKPEHLNAPFNSMYNDYMMAIDDKKGVGWFASDRFQPAGKVCIYTFIPNVAVKNVESSDLDYLASRGLICSIRDSWKKGVDYADRIALARRTVCVPKVLRHSDFEFVINDDLTYFHLSDFKNKIAASNYAHLLSLKCESGKISNRLEGFRTGYDKATVAEKLKLKPSILSLEQQLDRLSADITNLEVLCRNQEIHFLLSTKKK